MTKAKAKPRGIIRRNDHMFVDADPVVYTTRHVHASVGKPKYAQLARDTGLAYGTVRNLLEGKTRRPQHYTVLLLMERGFGYTETWHRASFPTRVVRASKRGK